MTNLIYKIYLAVLVLLVVHVTLRDSSLKNENSVINYSPSCRSKPIRPSFIFGTQIKSILMKSESFLTLHIDGNGTTTFKAQKRSKDIIKIVHVTSVVQP